MKREYYSFSDIFENNKQLVYNILQYLSGIVISSIFFKNATAKGEYSSFFKAIIINSDNSFLTYFFSRATLYLILILAVLMLSFCVYGFVFLKALPLMCGIGAGIKISYYYSLSAMGILFGAIVTAFQFSLFLTVFIFMLKRAGEFSKSIYNTSIKRTDTADYESVKQYLKAFSLYSIIIVFVSLINALIIYLLSKFIHF